MFKLGSTKLTTKGCVSSIMCSSMIEVVLNTDIQRWKINIYLIPIRILMITLYLIGLVNL